MSATPQDCPAPLPQDALQDFFSQDAVTVARALIGWHFTVNGAGGRIVETEAYTGEDPASHSFRGKTARNAAMFGPPAHVYVYRSYGLHLCVNLVCRPGDAVLVRAIEPLCGLEAMLMRRPVAKRAQLCSGPGKLCAALGIAHGMDGSPAFDAPFALRPDAVLPVVAGPRIGITRNADAPWRFCAAGSPFLSRRMG